MPVQCSCILWNMSIFCTLLCSTGYYWKGKLQFELLIWICCATPKPCSVNCLNDFPQCLVLCCGLCKCIPCFFLRLKNSFKLYLHTSSYSLNYFSSCKLIRCLWKCLLSVHSDIANQINNCIWGGESYFAIALARILSHWWINWVFSWLHSRFFFLVS